MKFRHFMEFWLLFNLADHTKIVFSIDTSDYAWSYSMDMNTSWPSIAFILRCIQRIQWIVCGASDANIQIFFDLDFAGRTRYYSAVCDSSGSVTTWKESWQCYVYTNKTESMRHTNQENSAQGNAFFTKLPPIQAFDRPPRRHGHHPIPRQD